MDGVHLDHHGFSQHIELVHEIRNRLGGQLRECLKAARLQVDQLAPVCRPDPVRAVWKLRHGELFRQITVYQDGVARDDTHGAVVPVPHCDRNQLGEPVDQQISLIHQVGRRVAARGRVANLTVEGRDPVRYRVHLGDVGTKLRDCILLGLPKLFIELMYEVNEPLRGSTDLVPVRAARRAACQIAKGTEEPVERGGDP